MMIPQTFKTSHVGKKHWRILVNSAQLPWLPINQVPNCQLAGAKILHTFHHLKNLRSTLNAAMQENFTAIPHAFSCLVDSADLRTCPFFGMFWKNNNFGQGFWYSPKPPPKKGNERGPPLKPSVNWDSRLGATSYATVSLPAKTSKTSVGSCDVFLYTKHKNFPLHFTSRTGDLLVSKNEKRNGSEEPEFHQVSSHIDKSAFFCRTCWIWTGEMVRIKRIQWTFCSDFKKKKQLKSNSHLPRPTIPSSLKAWKIPGKKKASFSANGCPDAWRNRESETRVEGSSFPPRHPGSQNIQLWGTSTSTSWTTIWVGISSPTKRKFICTCWSL